MMYTFGDQARARRPYMNLKGLLLSHLASKKKKIPD